MPNITPLAIVAVAVGGLVTLASQGLHPVAIGAALANPAPASPALASPAPASPSPAPSPAPSGASPANTGWTVPDVDALPDNDWGRTVRHGRDLIVKTYALIGPEVSDPAHRFAGNNLACQSCHIDAGTKQFGLPFQGVYADFPNYRARSGAVGTIEDRIQGCMERSMNGRKLPPGSPELTAMVAYLKVLSDGRPVGAPTPGRGAGHMPELTSAADPARGHVVYNEHCAACHGADGLGHRVGAPGDAQGYVFPPLWGPDSFNDGAGMDRLIGAANFVHSNMPAGTTWQAPALSVQDAWDVAAFVQSQPRPHKQGLDHDFPVRTQKPVDAGYGPYVDGLPETQHRLGPFAPIRQRVKAIEHGASKPAG